MLPDVDPADALPPMTAYYVMKRRTHRPRALLPARAIRRSRTRSAALPADTASVLLANHGPVVAGKDLEAAVYATEELEETAKLRLLLHGLNPRLLTRAQVRDLVTHFKLDESIGEDAPEDDRDTAAPTTHRPFGHT